ncbi:DUF2000 domain-containing protein [Anaerostipes sp.]|uniref:DUF2000 domain-containing protein n=1 Tax=Anaerostipes sp. TaxID=1872530 RepID=UPI0025B95510|nr:DUF2000 domain-containing protein [Anaerostipes sp.]MBS7008139.1 DUF2000 domain-containing protein [Anaerostipes sp.]
MNIEKEKCAVVVDEALPSGIAVNTGVILGLTMGKHMPEAIGPDVRDGDGNEHRGIITFPVPVLKAGREVLKELRDKLNQPEFKELLSADFSDVAQSCGVYSEFMEKISRTPEEQLNYLGIAICGPKKLVNKLTGNLPLLR